MFIAFIPECLQFTLTVRNYKSKKVVKYFDIIIIGISVCEKQNCWILFLLKEGYVSKMDIYGLEKLGIQT